MTLYTFRVNRSAFSLNIEWYAYLCSIPIFMQRLLHLLCLLYPCLLNAQPLIEREFGGPGYQRGEESILLPDGGYAVAASGNDSTTGFLDAMIIRLDSNANELWSKQYGGFSSDFTSSIAPTADGGFVVAATTYSFSSDPGTTSDWWLLRLNDQGDTLWTRTFPKPGNDRMYDIHVNRDGSLLLTGWISISGYARGTIMKVSEQGDSLWSFSLGSSGNSFAQFSSELSDGRYVMAGARLFGNWQAWIGLFDTSGTLLNSYSYETPVTNSYAQRIFEHPNGGYLLGGRSGTSLNMAPFIARLNDQFDTLWTRNYRNTVDINTQEDDFPITMTAEGGAAFGGGRLVAGLPVGSIYKTDTSGNVVWVRDFPDPYDKKFIDAFTAPNGDFVFTGYARGFSNVSCEAYLIRCDTSGSTGTTTAVTELETPRVLVYPNPVRDEVVYLQAPSPAPRTVQLLDAAGRIVLTRVWTTESLALPLSSLSAGWYIVEIREGDRVQRERILR